MIRRHASSTWVLAERLRSNKAGATKSRRIKRTIIFFVTAAYGRLTNGFVSVCELHKGVMSLVFPRCFRLSKLWQNLKLCMMELFSKSFKVDLPVNDKDSSVKVKIKMNCQM
jgi:hypothetical protein